jgi:hypothetical protein
MPVHPEPHQLFLNLINKFDFSFETKRRRRLYIKFSTLLMQLDCTPVYSKLPGGTVPYGYPFYAIDEVGFKVQKLANKLGFDCMKWPDLPSNLSKPISPHYKSLWLVNFSC